MKNIEMSRDGDALVIVIDLTKDQGPSKSGKTIVVATTQGNVEVPDIKVGQPRMFIGVNVYKKP